MRIQVDGVEQAVMRGLEMDNIEEGKFGAGAGGFGDGRDRQVKDSGSGGPSNKSAEPVPAADLEAGGKKIRAMIKAKLGEEVYSSWFNSLEFDKTEGQTLYVSVAVKFLRNWIQGHYLDTLLACAKT